MPFVFVVIGLLFLVVAIRGTQAEMFALLKSEFVGTNSFVPWVAALLILGSLGYAKPIRPITDAMMGLIILVMILANKGGFFAAFNRQIDNPTAPSTPAPAPSTGNGLSGWAPNQPTNPATGSPYAPGTPFVIDPLDVTQGGALGPT